MSTFSGRIRDCSWISIDHFGDENLFSMFFFLSHCHQDHMKGLADDSFYDRLSNQKCFLYCHPTTLILLEAFSQYKRILKYIKTEVVGETFHVTNSSGISAEIQPTNSSSSSAADVTFIDAKHCPGSIMILLEFDTGKRVLYTGDFRFVKDDWLSCKILRDPENSSTFKRIDELYFDSTFCRRGSEAIPSRKQSGVLFVRMVKEWLDARPDNKVLVWSSNYGQEFLLRALFDELNVKTHVTMQKFRVYCNIPEMASFVTSVASSTRVHACTARPDNGEECFEESGHTVIRSFPNSYRRRQRISTCALCRPDNDTVRIIKPSTIWFARRKEANVLGYVNANFCRLLYSSHSSFEELIDAFTLLRPVRAYPNVVDKRSTRKHEAKINAFFERLLSNERKSPFVNALSNSVSPIKSEAVKIPGEYTGVIHSSQLRRSTSCDIFSDCDEDNKEDTVAKNISANCLIGRKRKASLMDDEDLRHPTHRENDKEVLDRKRKDEDVVDSLSDEVDRRSPNLVEERSTIEENNVSCSEDSVSLADTIPLSLSSDRDTDSPLSERRCDSPFGNDVEEDLNLHLELSEPFSSPQSSGPNAVRK
uniref:Protein artemis n=1 Tax=Parascaris univalens TaxID=6257 RepID=A0A915BRU4_PARUN